ncbi:flexible cuticle protein 12 [Eurosta solidaginis]|uniref:flexible cuticle protein 12 n=1 Tax=Eurosta solidaginis TaxID=178769 RepID=UPI003530D92A
MKAQIIYSVAVILLMQSTKAMVTENLDNGEQLQHFDFKTENGQTRTEDVKYNQPNTDVIDESADKSVTDTTTVKPVEFRGGYSFISADGYEYTVLYKANKNGFQPYVTARKLRNDKV